MIKLLSQQKLSIEIPDICTRWVSYRAYKTLYSVAKRARDISLKLRKTENLIYPTSDANNRRKRYRPR